MRSKHCWREHILTSLPPLPDRSEIHRRLELIFPAGLTNRNYLTREMAASTVFVMLYVGAVDGTDYHVKPDQITRMPRNGRWLRT
jgi:hypothetical protein